MNVQLIISLPDDDEYDEEEEMIKDEEIAEPADFDLLPDDNDIDVFGFNVRVDADYGD